MAFYVCFQEHSGSGTYNAWERERLHNDQNRQGFLEGVKACGATNVGHYIFNAVRCDGVNGYILGVVGSQ